MARTRIPRPGSYYKEKYGGRVSGKPRQPREPREPRRPGKEKRDQQALDLHLNDDCLQIIQKTVSEAQGLLQDTAHQTHAGLTHVPVEIERVQKWRLDPADAEQRSLDLQRWLVITGNRHSNH